MQALCVGWIIPAIGLVWAGFATIGLRSLSEAEITASLERLQAMVVMLSIFSVPIGCIWALRTWSHVPGLAVVESKRRLGGPTGHMLSLVVAISAIVIVLSFGPHVPAAALVASIAGCYAALLIARWMQHAPLSRSFPAAVLSAGAAFQATVGWMHVLHPGGRLAPLLVVEGLALTWAAIAAARVIASVEPALELAPAFTEAAGVNSSISVAEADATVDLISQAPALQSLPEPAVGH